MDKPKLQKIEHKEKVLQAWWKNLAIVAVINMLSIVGILLILANLDKAAQKLSETRSTNIAAQQQSEGKVLQDDLQTHISDINRLHDLFLNDEGLLRLIDNIDSLKSQGVISNFATASNNLAEDAHGYPGIAVTIELQGSQDQINQSWRQIQSLSVIISPVVLEITKTGDDNYFYKFGGFLHVDEALN